MPYSAWVEKRRNYAPDADANIDPIPSFWTGQNTAGQTSVGRVGSGSVRYTLQTSGPAGINFEVDQVMPAGTTAARLLVRARANKPMQVNVRINESTSTEALWGTLGTDWTWIDYKTTGYGTGTRSGLVLRANDHASGDWIEIEKVLVADYSDTGDWFSGFSPNDESLPSLFQYRFVSSGSPASASVYETRTYSAGTPITPVPERSVSDVLYGDRTTSYRWEVLRHESNGTDSVIGTLDGVSDATLRGSLYAAVKGSGNVSVLDLAQAQAGMLRVADLTLETVRLRPVQQIDGLPDNPLGVYLVDNAKEDWDTTGRGWKLSLLDRTTVPQQDAFEESYSVPAGTSILAQVKSVLASCNEAMSIDTSVNLLTATGMVWEAGTSKLVIINDLLDAAGYSALTIDGNGNFLATPRVLPADRPLTYDVLGLPRELTYGSKSVYTPDWTRERDSFDVPNKVIAIESAAGTDTAAVVGVWTNTDPKSPYSYPSRGRWIPHVLDMVDVPDGTPAQKLAALQARARATLVQMSAVQAEVKLEHLPLPLRVGDVLRFSHKPAGIDSRHLVTAWSLEANSLGMMKTTIQEVVSL